MENVYLIIILAFIPLYPYKMDRMLRKYPSAFDGKEGLKKARHVFRTYWVILILIFTGSIIFQPQQIKIVLNAFIFLGIPGFLMVYVGTHKSETARILHKINHWRNAK